jgi:hypothetical protein
MCKGDKVIGWWNSRRIRNREENRLELVRLGKTREKV